MKIFNKDLRLSLSHSQNLGSEQFEPQFTELRVLAICAAAPDTIESPSAKVVLCRFGLELFSLKWVPYNSVRDHLTS